MIITLMINITITIIGCHRVQLGLAPPDPEVHQAGCQGATVSDIDSTRDRISRIS